MTKYKIEYNTLKDNGDLDQKEVSLDLNISETELKAIDFIQSSRVRSYDRVGDVFRIDIDAAIEYIRSNDWLRPFLYISGEDLSPDEFLEYLEESRCKDDILLVVDRLELEGQIPEVFHQYDSASNVNPEGPVNGGGFVAIHAV